MPKALQSVGLLVDLHPHVREPALAIGDLSHQLVPARLGIAHERVGARLRVRDDARRFFLGRLHDRPIDRAAHLVDIGGLIGVDPQRTGLVPQLNLGSVPHLLLQIVPKFLVQGLIERPRAHLLVVEPPVHDWRERHVHVIAHGRAVLANLVPVDEAAHHVLLAKFPNQEPVGEAEKLKLVPLADVLGQRHDHISHHHGILADGTFTRRLGGFIDPLNAPLNRCPVRLDAIHGADFAVSVIQAERVVALGSGRVDVLPTQTGCIAAVVSEHMAARCGLVFRDVSHRNLRAVQT